MAEMRRSEAHRCNLEDIVAPDDDAQNVNNSVFPAIAAAGRAEQPWTISPIYFLSLNPLASRHQVFASSSPS